MSLIPDFNRTSYIPASSPACPLDGERRRTRSRPLSRGDRLAKRAFDLCISASLLVLFAPLMLLLALAIRLDGQGPAVFGQERVGRFRRPFTSSRSARRASATAPRRLAGRVGTPSG